MKKTPILLLPLLINSVFSMKSADLHLFKMAQLGIAALGLGHVLYQNEKNTTEQRKKGHIFTSILGKDGKIAVPGEGALLCNGLKSVAKLSLQIATSFVGPIISLGPEASCIVIPPLVGLSSVPLFIEREIEKIIFETPTDMLAQEYVKANPLTYLQQVKANHLHDSNNTMSPKDICAQGTFIIYNAFFIS